MRGFHRIAFIGIEKEPVWPENKNDRHYSLTFSIDIHYRGRCPQAVVSAPFPPSCRCRQNGGVKQKFVVVAAMVGQQLPCALRRAMCPASGAAVPRGRCTTAFSHPSPLLCRASFPFKSSRHPELLSRFPTDPPCRMGRVSFGPPESCSWRVSLGERLYGYSGPWPVFAAFPPLAKPICYLLITKSRICFIKITIRVIKNHAASLGVMAIWPAGTKKPLGEGQPYPNNYLCLFSYY